MCNYFCLHAQTGGHNVDIVVCEYDVTAEEYLKRR